MARRLHGFRLTALACALAVTAGALVSASGVLADATPAAAQAVHVRLAYRCRFPAGPHAVSVTVAGFFPASATAGQPIKPSRLHTTVTFPRTAVARLRRLGATAVTAREVLATTVADNASAATALWPGRVRKPAPLPATDRLRLTFSGTAPPVTAHKPGTVTFTPAGLSLALDLRKANAAQANQAVQTVTCTLASGQDAKLATVAVTAAPTRLSQPGHAGGGRHAKGSAPSVGGGIPKGCAKRFIRGGTSSPVLGCAYLIGYADIHKLDESALIGPGPGGAPRAALLRADTYGAEFACVPREPTPIACLKHHGKIHQYTCTDVQLDYHYQLQFPPAKATFLTFGFAPVTATAQLSEAPWPRNHPPTEDRRCYRGGFSKAKRVRLKSPIVSVFNDTNTGISTDPIVNIGTTYLTIHLSHVTANGVPLPVGPDCGTTRPMRTVLIGRGTNTPYSGYTLSMGGPLTGRVTVPAFEHCGVGENLDPLLTASISGPGNFQLITQGTLCTPLQSGKPGCPPTIPKPRRHVK